MGKTAGILSRAFAAKQLIKSVSVEAYANKYNIFQLASAQFLNINSLLNNVLELDEYLHSTPFRYCPSYVSSDRNYFDVKPTYL